MSSERITTGLNQPAIRYTLTFVEIDDPRTLYSTLNEIAGYRIHVVDKFNVNSRKTSDLHNDIQYMIAVGRKGQSISEQSLYTFRLSTFNSAGLSRVLLGEVEERSDAVLETAAFIAGNKTASAHYVPQFSVDAFKSDPDPFAEVGRTVKDLAALSEQCRKTTLVEDVDNQDHTMF